jgi:S-formylglutathione hydrolase FrmB
MYRLLILAVVSLAGFVNNTAQTADLISLPPSVKLSVKFADARELGSKLMGRKVPFLVVTPGKYEISDTTTRFPVIYLLHGLTGSHKNWVEKTKLLQYATNSGFIVVTPEGITAGTLTAFPCQTTNTRATSLRN